MNVVCFRYCGRFGHFLKAEANASAPSYPVPPRTALIGLIGAILGLEKDQPQILLKDARLAVAGRIPGTHWHSANLRKDPPAPLPYSVKKFDKGTTARQRNTIIAQEWLIEPDYRVWTALPDPFQDELIGRLVERRWHYTPCLGLSEMIADLSCVSVASCNPVQGGLHEVVSVIRRDAGTLDTEAACEQELAVLMLRMPRAVSENRAFRHAAYYVEREARPVPVHTDQAWAFKDEKVVFL